ncbi:hypothetical protein [Sphingomonas sp.]|uniref:hypothetical protein n=1 Tax=Sphingomonas sp. TaxID=28214 RepID=UPI003B00C419
MIHAGFGARDHVFARRARPRAGAIVVPGQLGLVRVLSGGGGTLLLRRSGWHADAPRPRCEYEGTNRLSDGDFRYGPQVVMLRRSAWLVAADENVTGGRRSAHPDQRA